MKPFTGAWLSLTALAAACMVGPRAENSPLARNAGGVRADVQVKSPCDALAGELLAVEDSALWVLADSTAGQAHPPRVTQVPMVLITRGRFARSYIEISGGRFPDQWSKAEVRRISRYPQGLSPGLTANLLAAYGQTEAARACP